MANTLRYNNTIPGNIYYNNAKVQNVYYNNTKVWSASRPFSFTYTGVYEVEGDLEGNFVIRFKTSGTLTITSHGNNTSGSYDLFAVGGGGGGGFYGPDDGALPYGGGGGGYTSTNSGVTLSKDSYQIITIGAGGAQNNGGATTSFGSYLSAPGGTSAKNFRSRPYSGGDGGSGGAPNHGNGGSDGSNGIKMYEAIAGTIGHGQGSTTREFGEATGILYAGGGGGGVYDSRYPYYFGGAGGGGNGARRYTGTTEAVAARAGTPNTGGGGGGGLNYGYDGQYYGASGGSGIACIRNHR